MATALATGLVLNTAGIAVVASAVPAGLVAAAAAAWRASAADACAAASSAAGTAHSAAACRARLAGTAARGPPSRPLSRLVLAEIIDYRSVSFLLISLFIYLDY